MRKYNLSDSDRSPINKWLMDKVIAPLRRWEVRSKTNTNYFGIVLLILAAAVAIFFISKPFALDKLEFDLASVDGRLHAVALAFISSALGLAFVVLTRSDIRVLVRSLGPTLGYNNDSSSINYTMKIIRKAKKWAIFYDYGELQPTNIYSSEVVADSLIEKLNSFPGFELSLVFRNSRSDIEKLPLIQRIREWQKENPDSASTVYIKCGVDRGAAKFKDFNSYCPENPYHYKINDRNYAYITKHAETKKKRRLIYASPWADWTQPIVKDCLGFHNTALSEPD